MKEYIKRITENSKKWEIVLWWIVRAIMIFGAIESFVNYGNYEDKIRTMMIGNFFLTFGWEIFQLFPKSHMFRYLPSAAQDFTSVYIVLTAFLGAYVDFYYKVWWWDTTLHFISGGLCVLAGYAFIRAYELRDSKSIPVAVACFAAFCASFMFGTLWECWEFSFDQISLMGGNVGDTQHWSYELAKDTPRLAHLIFQPALDPDSPNWMARFALIDTMTDIVANTLGACIGGVALRIALRKKAAEQKAADKLNKKEFAVK